MSTRGTGSTTRPVASASMYIQMERSTLANGKRTNKRALESRPGWMAASMRATTDKARRMVKLIIFFKNNLGNINFSFRYLLL